MIVDIADREHLCKEIIKDYDPLVRKYILILKQVRKVVGNKKLKSDYSGNQNGVEYRVPERKTLWRIFYRIYKNTTIEKTRFVSIHKHIENKKTFYIAIDSQQTEEVILQIFNPHFIERVMERLELTFTSNEIGVAQFSFDEEFRNLVKWEESVNATNYYQITKWGLSLGEYDENQKTFYNKTFVSKKELFEDQNNDLKQHFLKAIKIYNLDKYKLFIKYWSEYLDTVEMLQAEMLNFDFNQKEKPAEDFFINEMVKNWNR